MDSGLPFLTFTKGYKQRKLFSCKLDCFLWETKNISEGRPKEDILNGLGSHPQGRL